MPFTVDVYRAAVDPKIRMLVMVFPSQCSKTETVLNIMGHRMDDDPVPMMAVFPTRRLAESVSQSRLMPMILSTPSLYEKLDKRKSANKVTEKFIAGTRLGLAWSGSATEMASHAVGLILIDELDRMDTDVAGEGDVVGLAAARITTFPDGKIIVASTPTIEGGSRIWSLFESGTQHVWHFSCPDCAGYFAPCFDLLKWPEKATPAQAKREARLLCPLCGSLIEDKHRTAMNREGKFIAQGDLESDTASFMVNGLASPWRTFGAAAAAWVEASRSREPEQMQSVMNTVFGQLWKLKGEAPEVTRVQALRSGYRSDELPTGARIITAGVDVQANRLYYAIRAWGVRSESWLLRHGELFGETDEQQVWSDLSALMDETWGAHRIRMMLVDSGFRPDGAYAFARRFPGRCMPSKGSDTASKPIYISKLDVNVKGKTQRHGVNLAHIDTNFFKSWVHGRIAWPDDEPGGWHLPTDASNDYCESIVAESRIVKSNGKVLWVRSGGTRNDYFDCEVLNAAAAQMLNVISLKRRPTDEQPAAQATTVQPAQAQPQRQPERKIPGLNSPSKNFSGRPAKKSWVRNW